MTQNHAFQVGYFSMYPFKFSLNVFIEFVEFNDKIFVIAAKELEPTISCVRDQDQWRI